MKRISISCVGLQKPVFYLLGLDLLPTICKKCFHLRNATEKVNMEVKTMEIILPRKRVSFSTDNAPHKHTLSKCHCGLIRLAVCTFGNQFK